MREKETQTRVENRGAILLKISWSWGRVGRLRLETFEWRFYSRFHYKFNWDVITGGVPIQFQNFQFIAMVDAITI